MIKDPESVAAIEKKVGKYEWRTGEEGDAAVRTLKSFIPPGALTTLSDFGKNQLVYNAIYKEALTNECPYCSQGHQAQSGVVS